MTAPSTAEKIREVNTRYHDGAASGYDAKWGIDFGEIGQAQVLGKLGKLIKGPLGPFPQALEIGAGTGYFSLNLVSAGVIGHATCTDISPGMLAALQANADRLGIDVDAVPCDAEQLPFDDASFDLVFGHAVLHHLPNLDRAFAEFLRVLKPGGQVAFAGEPSRYGDRIANYPKRAANRLAPAWRALMRARPAVEGHSDGGAENHQLESQVDVHAFTPQDRGLRGRSRARRGAAGELVRLDEPRPRGDRRPGDRADGLAPVRLPRLHRAAEARSRAARAAAAAGDLLQPHGRGAEAALTAAMS
jgi:SAM-dependent methyltransferase